MTDRLLTDEEVGELPIPDEIKKLISQTTQSFHMVVRELAGNIELAYWRGKQENDQAQDSKTLKAVGEWLEYELRARGKGSFGLLQTISSYRVLRLIIDQLKQGKMPE